MHNNPRPARNAGLMGSDYVDDLPHCEPSYRDRLYIQFGQGMSFSHHLMFQNLPRERKDYLFELWLKRNGYV